MRGNMNPGTYCNQSCKNLHSPTIEKEKSETPEPCGHGLRLS